MKKNKRKFMSTLAVIGALTTCFSPSNVSTVQATSIPITSNSFGPIAADKEAPVPDIYINGLLYEIPKGYTAVMRNDRIMVPLKCGIFDVVGAETTYDIINQEVTIKTKTHILATYVKELDWYDSGIRCYISDVRSDLISDEVYVPLRVVMECLGYNVDYFTNNGNPKAVIS